MGVQYELGFVVQFVDDDVVAAAEVHRMGHDVLAFARGEEEADLVRARVDQLCVLRTHCVGLPQHVAEGDRRVAFRNRKLAARVHDRNRGRRDVRRVQEERGVGDGEIRAHTERIRQAAGGVNGPQCREAGDT